MHVSTLQIAWHEKLPVLSCDFHPSGQLVTCGADHEIKVWTVSEATDGAPMVTFQGNLKNHTKAVNCIRFDPKGECLVSAGDGGEIFMWRHNPQGDDGPACIHRWKATNSLRGHSDDVLDLSWSHDGTGLASSSIENAVIVWDVAKCKKKQSFTKHKHYVQGVAWDPFGEMIVSQSTDRTMKVLGLAQHKRKRWLGHADVARAAEFSLLSTVYKHGPHSRVPLAAAAKGPGAAGATPTPLGEQKVAVNGRPAAEAAPRAEYIFQGEGLNTFFRRLAFSPDGSFLVAPAATLGSLASSNKCASAAVIFTRKNLSAPSAVLPSLAAASTCVRFCSCFYKSKHAPPPAANSTAADQLARGASRADGGLATPTSATSVAPAAASGAAPARLCQLPYKLVFAVGCIDSVIIYDTDCEEPLAVLGAIHYKHVTDMAWSPDGLRLAVTSHDGYCTLALFTRGELGEPLPACDTPDVGSIKAEITARFGQKKKKVDRPSSKAAEKSEKPVDTEAPSVAQACTPVVAVEAPKAAAPGAGAGAARRLVPTADSAATPNSVSAQESLHSSKRRAGADGAWEMGQHGAQPTPPAKRRLTPVADATPASASHALDGLDDADTVAERCADGLGKGPGSGPIEVPEVSAEAVPADSPSKGNGPPGDQGVVLVSLPEASVRPGETSGFSLALLAAQAGAAAAQSE